MTPFVIAPDAHVYFVFPELAIVQSAHATDTGKRKTDIAGNQYINSELNATQCNRMQCNAMQ